MTSRLAAALSLALLAGCDGCNRAPAPRPDAASARPDAARAASADAGARRDDPCAILEDAQRNVVVARVGDQTLTLCDFTRRINTNNPYLRARFNAPEQRRALLQSWIDAELLAAEARARGLDQEPEVRRAVTMQLARRLEMVERQAVAQPEVTEAEARAWYDAHRAEYVTEAQVRASQIVLSTPTEAARVLAEVRAQEGDDALFRARARTLSVDGPSRAAEGDLGFFPAAGSATVPPEVAAAAFALTRDGEVAAQVVESAHGGPAGREGYHVVRRTARRDALDRSFEDESRRIRARLQRERREQAEEAAMRALVARLRGASTVTVDDAALARVTVSAPAGAPPALVGPSPLAPHVPPPAPR